MDTEQMTAEQVIAKYKTDIDKLAAYLTWLTEKSGRKTADIYGQDGIATHSLAFPVYDAMLLRFVQDAKQTCFMDPNYRYVYSRYRMKDSTDELTMIQRVTITQMHILGGILSKYVLGGQTKARLWSQGVSEGIFLNVVKKAGELIEFWDPQAKG